MFIRLSLIWSHEIFIVDWYLILEILNFRLGILDSQVTCGRVLWELWESCGGALREHVPTTHHSVVE